MSNPRKQSIGRYKPKSRVSLTRGVFRKSVKDGCGNTNDFYFATICVNGTVKVKKFSIKRLGEDGARLAASLQRMLWIVDFGVWHPRDGDPFALVNYNVRSDRDIPVREEDGALTWDGFHPSKGT